MQIEVNDFVKLSDDCKDSHLRHTGKITRYLGKDNYEVTWFREMDPVTYHPKSQLVVVAKGVTDG